MFLDDLNVDVVVAVEIVFAVSESVDAGYEGTRRPVDASRSGDDGFSCFNFLLESGVQLRGCDMLVEVFKISRSDILPAVAVAIKPKIDKVLKSMMMI